MLKDIVSMSIGKVIDFTALGADIQKLIREAAAVREFSYSPYSKFKVGAAILCSDGAISRGCNVENASYSVVTCAERAAIATAVSMGTRTFVALALIADSGSDRFTTPCGMCRQAIAEFGNVSLYLTNCHMNRVLCLSIGDLLPMSFDLPKSHGS